jgi:hypothetical protein
MSHHPPPGGAPPPGDAPPPIDAPPLADAPTAEVDLTAEDLEKFPQKKVERAETTYNPKLITDRPFNLEEAQEKTRAEIAKALTTLLISTVTLLVVLAAAGTLALDKSASLLSSVVAVTGTALGFYFGSRSTKKD